MRLIDRVSNQSVHKAVQGLGYILETSMPKIPQLLSKLSARRKLAKLVQADFGPPCLSLLGMVIIGLAMISTCLAIAAWQTYGSLKEQHALATQSLQERFELAFSSVSEDLKRLAQLPNKVCSPAISQELARQSLRSEFARGFFIEIPASESLCGPFGATDFFVNQINQEHSLSETQSPDSALPNLPKAADAASFSVTGIRSLKPLMMVRYTSTEGNRIWAEVPSNRILAGTTVPKKISADQGLSWSLDDLLGKPIFRQGSKEIAPGRSLHSQEQVSEQYGYRLKTVVSWEQFKTKLNQVFLPWCLLGAICATVLIKGINQHYSARMSPERKMKLAIRKRQIEPVIQPIVSLASGECLGGEVLMRWKHPVRGLIPPAEFINLAEENGMIIPMSELLMRKARDQLAELQRSSMYFSFNITAAQLRDPMFPQKILQIFDGTGLPPESVVLELTEREAMGEQDGQILGRLRSLGFRIAIDDFGTGQSSLSMLQGLEIDRIKIDREFVRTIDESTERRPVLDTIIVLAQELAVPVIAEGIETQAQWDYLRKRKVEAAQGYLIAKPMLITDFIQWQSARDITIALTPPLKFEGRLRSSDRREATRAKLPETVESLV
jgi:sensor c-di-GMP phosphodiesterase-like protein